MLFSGSEQGIRSASANIMFASPRPACALFLPLVGGGRRFKSPNCSTVYCLKIQETLHIRSRGDSNPRNPRRLNGFQDRLLKPLGHRSRTIINNTEKSDNCQLNRIKFQQFLDYDILVKQKNFSFSPGFNNSAAEPPSRKQVLGY